jgi:hypothetical protein
MADWRKLCIAVALSDGVRDDEKVKILRKEFWTDGKPDEAEVEFLIELHSLAQKKAEALGFEMNPNFEELVYDALVFAEDKVRLPEPVWRAIKARIGQPEFRGKLLLAYGRRCALTDCDAEPALEAAHIRGYAETGEQDVSNGLLLRADIHTLFDLGLVRIHPETLRVTLAPELERTCYGELRGRKLRLPERPVDRPSREALQKRWEVAR